LLAVRGLARIEAVRGLQLDVTAFPPALERREIVTPDRGERERRVGLRRDQTAVLVLLERQYSIRKDASLAHPLAKPFGHRAEVLADDEAAVADALERDDPDELVERIPDVGAVRRRLAACDPVLPHQAHRVVDPKASGVP